MGGTPDQVLDLLTDPRAIAHWAPIGFDVAELDGDRLHEGCAVKVSGVIAGRRLVFDVEITRASDRCLALRADGPIVIEGIGRELSRGEHDARRTACPALAA